MIPKQLMAAVILWCASTSVLAEPSRYFRLQVVDEQTGRGVPLVELRTVSDVTYITDSAGLAAIDEPGLAGKDVYFHVRSHGYEAAKDGFGFRGARVRLEPGGAATIRIKRLNVAERLYRITGEGIYRDSVLLGDIPPTRHPLLNGLVAGQDSCVNAVYRGRLYWFWGDTDRVAYPLGNYRVSGAVTDLAAGGGLDPAVGVDLRYFVNDQGFSREMFPSSEPGAIWVFGPMVLREGNREILATHYSRMKNVGHRYEHGIGVWNDEAERFEKRAEFPLDAPLYPHGQPVEVEASGERWYYFPNPYPVVRVRAKLDDVLDPARYEAFTCYEAGTRNVERDSDGNPIWRWKANTPAVKHARGLFETDSGFDGAGPQGIFHLRDVETGKLIRAHGGSVFWNEHRNRWVMIALEAWGNSPLGEVWYAEGQTVLGPWVYARRIVSHDKYSFYNVKQHPYFDAEGGRWIYFEGTYTDFVSGAPHKTPRYDYNQIMYRLDLDDPRLNLPSPVTDQDGAIRFYALLPERANEGTVAVPADQPVFRGLPLDAPPNSALVRLFAYRNALGQLRYSAEEHPIGPGWERGKEPLCLVWRSPRLDPPGEPETRAVRVVPQ
jgi:hypothetical protein